MVDIEVERKPLAGGRVWTWVLGLIALAIIIWVVAKLV